MNKKNINSTIKAMEFLRNAYKSKVNNNLISFQFNDNLNKLKKVSNQVNDKEMINLISKI